MPVRLLAQNDLAATLEAIALGGRASFYEGPIAQKIVAAVKEAGGVMDADDLKNYAAKQVTPLREPIGATILSRCRRPATGGTHLIEMLNILEGFPLGNDKAGFGFGSPQALHLMIEAMKIAYADRAEFLGDTGIKSISVNRLISKDYANKVRSEIDPKRARNAKDVRPTAPRRQPPAATPRITLSSTRTAMRSPTPIRLISTTGLALSPRVRAFCSTIRSTTSLPSPARRTPSDSLGGDANAPGPAKRPLSSMTPTIVLKDKKPVMSQERRAAAASSRRCCRSSSIASTITKTSATPSVRPASTTNGCQNRSSSNVRCHRRRSARWKPSATPCVLARRPVRQTRSLPTTVN